PKDSNSNLLLLFTLFSQYVKEPCVNFDRQVHRIHIVPIPLLSFRVGEGGVIFQSVDQARLLNLYSGGE
ncbi:hypothetical protein ACMH5Q_11490, partial [Aquirufa lenticrescens]